MKLIPAKDPSTIPSDSRRVLVVVKRPRKTFTAIGSYYRTGELELHHDVDPWHECYTPDEGGTWYAPEGWYSDICEICEMCDTLEDFGSVVVGWAELPTFDTEGQEEQDDK